eukprot:TRINITY_DN44195_c0_g1_i1.p1 TRINITY_DN44195_c0_g1~~TRINITY_DN44195_c0_g1_i1.p1  ORF type:complete len:193 (+),score=24.43 TRINITY_DN44195_c0_g1_i1:96-674(+)
MTLQMEFNKKYSACDWLRIQRHSFDKERKIKLHLTYDMRAFGKNVSDLASSQEAPANSEPVRQSSLSPLGPSARKDVRCFGGGDGSRSRSQTTVASGCSGHVTIDHGGNIALEDIPQARFPTSSQSAVQQIFDRGKRARSIHGKAPEQHSAEDVWSRSRNGSLPRSNSSGSLGPLSPLSRKLSHNVATLELS